MPFSTGLAAHEALPHLLASLAGWHWCLNERNRRQRRRDAIRYGSLALHTTVPQQQQQQQHLLERHLCQAGHHSINPSIRPYPHDTRRAGCWHMQTHPSVAWTGPRNTFSLTEPLTGKGRIQSLHAQLQFPTGAGRL